jgi:hypothetical protein
MKFGDWIMIAAILCGPVLAVQAQKWIETAREKRNRRLNVFKRLMATRGAVLSPGHVEALNMIDLEFAGRGRRNEQVRRRWREYLDHLGSLTQDPEEQARNLPVWTERSGNLLADLLHDMGMAVGYDFDRVQIRRGIYIPMGHANFEMETQLLRRLLIQLLVGERSLPLEVRSLPSVRQKLESTTPPVDPADALERYVQKLESTTPPVDPADALERYVQKLESTTPPETGKDKKGK